MLMSAPLPSQPAGPKLRRSKYGNKRVTHDGMTFDSKAEVRWWEQLKLRQMAGEISDLKRQVPFLLVINSVPVKIRSDGYPKGRVCRYTADFTYTEGGVRRILDVKGADDPASRLRRAVVEAIYGVVVEVVR